MTTFRDHPGGNDQCRKCGEAAGWNPSYHENAHAPAGYSSWSPTRFEHMDWTCLNCGYFIQTECFDAAYAKDPAAS